LRAEAESQIELLTHAEKAIQADFYSYRYFASEGFLPGYSFPRLPLSAYIPGRRDRRGRDEFLSRPRFLAISEFGPRAIVYHEGAQYVISKVILPARGEGEDLITSSAKQCAECGYVHPITAGDGPDLCEHCGARLGQPLSPLFRFQNVTARRRSRISSDEEERMRLGYEMLTGFRFTDLEDGPSYRTAQVSFEGGQLLALTYGGRADIWRMNLGWSRRSNREQYGFVLDTERGTWAKSEHDSSDDPEDPMSPKNQRVIPFVEDRRNCLLVKPASTLDQNAMATLQAALKNAIQFEYQLEDSELAAEPLPSRKNRRVILLYEAAEGGAGVLRHLIDDPQALSRVAKRALHLCHFEADTGADRHRAERASEDCEAACYDCLMNYTNQADHRLLDRQLVRNLLLDLSKAVVEASPGPAPRTDHLAMLIKQCDSELEKRWLKHLQEHNLRLPSRAQAMVDGCRTRPDFLYDKECAAIYIDGPPHDYPERQQRDRQQTACMEDSGFSVIRFAADDDWGSIIRLYPHIFGRLA
jgi:very-short-patch-repair endonuclease